MNWLKVALWSLAGLLATVALGILVLYQAFVGPRNPTEAVFSAMGGAVPRESISFAKQTGFGVDPTYIATIDAHEATNWPGLFYKLGKPTISDAKHSERIRQDVATCFAAKAQAATNIFSGPNYEPWECTINGRPYVLTALISTTNAFVILGKY